MMVGLRAAPKRHGYARGQAFCGLPKAERLLVSYRPLANVATSAA
jgi:hypothetical protein